MDVNGVADAHPNEGARNFAIEGPVAKRRGFGEPTFDFHAHKVDTDGLWFSLCDGRREVRRLTRDIRFHQRLRWRTGGDDELALHTRLLVPWHAAKIFKVTGLGGAERDRRACAFAGHAWRASVLIGKHDIMFSALTIDQRKLDDLAF